MAVRRQASAPRSRICRNPGGWGGERVGGALRMDRGCGVGPGSAAAGEDRGRAAEERLFGGRCIHGAFADLRAGGVDHVDEKPH